MAGLILPDIVNRLLDDNGNPISNGTATFYVSGTTTKADIYTDSTLETELPNPISTNAGGLYINSSGSPCAIYLDEQVSYRCIVKDADGDQIRDIDPISIAPREVIDIRSFGAKCDGTTDDSPAISAAIEYAHLLINGAEIVIPQGITRITQTIDVGDYQNIYFKGKGPNTSYIRTTTGMTKAFNFGSAGSHHGGISNLKISCELSAQCTGITITGFENFFLDTVEIVGAYDGIRINSGLSQFFTNFRINNSIRSAIWIAGGNDQYFSRGLCYNASTRPTTGGIVITGSEASWFSDIDTINCNNGLYIAPATSAYYSKAYISWLFFSQCAFDQGDGSGIYLAPASGFINKGFTFINCWCGSNTSSGVNMSGAGTNDGMQFIGHRSYRNGQHGYYVGATSKNIHFDACSASGNSAPFADVGGTINTCDGFNIAANVSDWSIRNCKSGTESDLGNATYSGSPVGNTQRYGIGVVAGTGDRYIIANNDLNGNATASLSLGATGTSRYVTQNLGAVTKGNGTATVLSGTSSIAVTHGLMATPAVSDIQLTPTSNLSAAGVSTFYVSAATSTTFTITLNTNCSSNVSFGWRASIYGS